MIILQNQKLLYRIKNRFLFLLCKRNENIYSSLPFFFFFQINFQNILVPSSWFDGTLETIFLWLCWCRVFRILLAITPMPAAWALQVALPVPLMVAHRAAPFSSLCDVATHSILSQPFRVWVPGLVSALGTGGIFSVSSSGFACAFTWLLVAYSSLRLKYVL